MRRDLSYVRPDTLSEALAFLQEKGETARVLCGGTDLVVGLRAGIVKGLCLVDVSGLSELKGIEETGDEIGIGSAVTITDIISSKAVARVAPALQAAGRVFGSRQIRNVATIGGNICRASPAGDALPALYAHDAQVELFSAGSSRRTALHEFIRGPGETARGPAEILGRVCLRKVPGLSLHRFDKVGNRRVLAVSIVSLAALVGVGEGGMIDTIRLAWGSVAPTVVRSTKTEQFLMGKPLTASTLKEAFPLVQAAISPIDDIRASAAYRRKAALGLLFRLLPDPAPSY